MKIYWDAGLRPLAKTIHKGNSVTALAKCQSFRRTHRFILHIWETFYRHLVQVFLQFRNQKNTELCKYHYSNQYIIDDVSNALNALEGKSSHERTVVHLEEYAEKQKETNALLAGLENNF